MFDHISLGVSDYKTACAFYDRVLGALGYERVMEFEGQACAYGPNAQQPMFWIAVQDDGKASPGKGTHVCFSAVDRKAVETFHSSGLTAGAKDEGAPGVRADYHPNYYAAFLFDPDGHKIEAVCHSPQ